eukprot:Opistho-2@96445
MTVNDLDSILDGGRYPPTAGAGNRKSAYGDDSGSGGHTRTPSKGSAEERHAASGHSGHERTPSKGAELPLAPKRALPPRTNTLDNTVQPPLPDAPKPHSSPVAQPAHVHHVTPHAPSAPAAHTAPTDALNSSHGKDHGHSITHQVEQLATDVSEMKGWCTKVASKLSGLRSSIGVSAQLATEVKTLQADVAAIREIVRGGASSVTHNHPRNDGGAGHQQWASAKSEIEMAAQVSALNDRLMQETRARMELQKMVLDMREEMERLKENL